MLSASGSQQATGPFGEPILLICHSHGLDRHVDPTMQGFLVWVGRIGVLNCDGLSKSESSAGLLWFFFPFLNKQVPKNRVALGSGRLRVSRQLGLWISRNLIITQDLHQ